MVQEGNFLLAIACMLSFLLETSASKCYQCVYYSNMDEGEPLRYQEAELLRFTKGYYDRDLFYKKHNTRKCLLGPTRAEDSTVLVSDCPYQCQTYYHEENKGKYVVIRSCAKQEYCVNENFVDDTQARNSKCCEDDGCNNDGISRATRCHRCVYNENMDTGETFESHYLSLGAKSKTGLSTTDIDKLGFRDPIPNQAACKYMPWDTDQVLCPSKTCSKLDFWRTIDDSGRPVHTIVRDCLKPGKSCQTEIQDGSIKCCMETVCNSSSYLYISWSVLIGFLAGCILLR